jgi:hypothetical protein
MDLTLRGVGVGKTKELAVVAVQRLSTRLSTITEQRTMTDVLHMKPSSLQWEGPTLHTSRGTAQEFGVQCELQGPAAASASTQEFGVQCELQGPAAAAASTQEFGVQCELQPNAAAAGDDTAMQIVPLPPAKGKGQRCT